MSYWVHHHDAQIFPQPDLWNPERWINATAAMKQTSTPYSYGPRSCIGQKLSNKEWVILTANIFLTCDLELRGTAEKDMIMMETFQR